MSRHRIALGGYRLADVMSAVAVNLPLLRKEHPKDGGGGGGGPNVEGISATRRGAGRSGGIVGLAARGHPGSIDQSTTVMLLSISAGVLAIVVVILGVLLFRK